MQETCPAYPRHPFPACPSQKILTLNMDVPEAWLVEPVKAELDLDNLRLADLGQKRSMTADFELESLMLTGSCIDVAATDRAQVQSVAQAQVWFTQWLTQRTPCNKCLQTMSRSQ